MKKTEAIGAAGVATLLAGIAFLLWGFWLQFVLLTLLYLAIGAGITSGVENYYDVEPGTYLKNNNTWLYVGLGAIAITSVIASFNFGPALLLPENFPSPEQRGGVSDFFNHLWVGKNAPPSATPTEPLPWTTGTWFWWKADGLFMFLTFFYAWFALSDEFNAGLKAAQDLFLERRREHAEKQHQGHEKSQAGKGHTEKDVGHLGTWDFLKLQLLVELAAEFLLTFWRHQRATQK